MSFYIPVVYPNYWAGWRANTTVPTGHAGAIVVGDDGIAKYFEWGRYDRNMPFVVTSNAIPADGNLRRVDLDTVLTVNSSGQLDSYSLNAALNEIANKMYPGRDTGIVFSSPYQITDGQYDQISSFISASSFEKYGTFSNSCFLFVQTVAATAGLTIAGASLANALPSMAPAAISQQNGIGYLHFGPNSWSDDRSTIQQIDGYLDFAAAWIADGGAFDAIVQYTKAMIGNVISIANRFTTSYNPQDNSYHIVGTDNGHNVIDATWIVSTNALKINTINSDGTHSSLDIGATGETIATYLPGGQLVELTTMANQGGVTTTWDVLNSFLWDKNVTEFSAPGDVLADTRDYSSVAAQWLVNHTLPTNLAKADEDFTVQFAAFEERSAYAGHMAGTGAPSPLSYESSFDSRYDFSASTLQINSGAVETVAVLNTGFGFDASFSGGSAGANTFKISLSIPFNDFGGIFDIFGPIILDLSGSGINITPRQDSNVLIDVDGDSFLERTAWAGPGDGILVIDLGGNNIINQVLEFDFAKRTTANPNDTDLEAIASEFDTNHDKVLDSRDERWGEFRVWTDTNQTGFRDASQLHTLAALGITSISLTTDHQAFQLPDGSRINGIGTFTRNGVEGTFADASLAYDTAGFKRVEVTSGFNYLVEGGVTKQFWDAKVEPLTDGSGQKRYDRPVFIPQTALYDGVFGGRFDDLIESSSIKGVTIYGDLGNDILKGGSFSDVLDGGQGHDALFGFGGDDTIYFDVADINGVPPGQGTNGGAGHDTGIFTDPFPLAISLAQYDLESLISNNGNDVITANPTAAAYIDGRGGNDTINGGPLGDTLIGGTGGDALYGNDGADLLSGGADADRLEGGTGNDVLLGGLADDVLLGGAGDDTIDGGLGTDQAIFGGVRGAYAIVRVGDLIQISGPEGFDVLTNVEFAVFPGMTFDLAGALPNQAPVITSNGGGVTASTGLAENLGAVTIVAANDANGGALSYAIAGGADWTRFQIDAATGALSFKTAPDFENPTDTDHDNSYVVTVRAWDGSLFDDQTITVTIANVTDVRWAATVATGTHPGGAVPVSTGDFDGEGTSDVLWYNAATKGVDLWKIAGGHWAGSQDMGAHPGAGWQIAPSGDFNADGTDDVLWFNANTGDTEVWKIQNGGWAGSVTIGAHPLGWQPFSAGDFNHDGNGDVLWYQQSSAGAEVWLLSNAQWAGSVYVGSHPGGNWQPVGTGDFDRDGTDDVLWWNAATGETDVWKLANGHWAGSLNPGAHPAGWTPAGIGDFNRDGTSDVAWFNPATGNLDLWLIQDGHWSASATIGSHPLGWSVAGIGDFDRNGVSDILWRETATNRTETWLLEAERRRTEGDFNGDGKADILWQADDGTRMVALMDGLTPVGAAYAGNPGPAWHTKAAADFNGDGKADIITQHDDGTPAIILMDGLAVITGGFLSNSGPHWHVVDAADFNGDGKADILWQADDVTRMVSLMDGLTTTSAAYAGNPGPAWHTKAAADFNGDGKADIVTQHDDGTPAIILMDGLNVIAGGFLSNSGPHWHVVDAADFNGDGRADILWQADDGTRMVSLMDGLTTTSAAYAGNPGLAWHTKAAADFNGDGKADIITQHDDGTPAVILMDGLAVITGGFLSNSGPHWHII